MFSIDGLNAAPRRVRIAIALALVAALLGLPGTAYAKKKKDKEKEEAPAAAPVPIVKQIEQSGKLVYPPPPGIARVKYVTHFAADKAVTEKEAKKKQGWMARMGGVATGNDPIKDKPFFQLAQPYGIAVNSQGHLFVVDTKVGAIFVWNTETRDLGLIANGKQAHFSGITGIAIDDDDRIFVSDAVLHHVLVFDKNYRRIAEIQEGMKGPAGMAMDYENRFLYVVDTDLDQVLVYDLDSLQLLRKMGKPDKHRATKPGLFAAPTNCAVDADGNLYVTDTFNNRVQIFDADGNFIETFGKSGDGPGYFARPKGIAIDVDGHVWVADSMQDRVQIFTPEGRLLMRFGGHGNLPGQFSALQGIYIDKNNRVFTSEQFMGRVQYYQYVPNAAARAELKRLEEEKKAKEAKRKGTKLGEKPAAKDSGVEEDTGEIQAEPEKSK